jgi:LPXTG-motif cell wall-anchored protein
VYTVVETKAVDGYILDETAYEVVLSYEDDATDCVTYTLSLTNKPIGGNSPQTGDDSNPWLWAGVGLAALIAGLGAFFWKRKDENVIE